MQLYLDMEYIFHIVIFSFIFCCRDLFSVTKNKNAFDLVHTILEEYAARYRERVDVVVGLESRGFIIGSLLARTLQCPFVPIRKKGKLLGEVLLQEYTLEYGKVSLNFFVFLIFKYSLIEIFSSHLRPISYFPGYCGNAEEFYYTRTTSDYC